MKALHRLTKQIALQQCTLVKRRVLQLFNHMHAAVTAHASAKSPQGQGQGLPIRCLKRQHLAQWREAKCQKFVTLRCLSLNIVNHGSTAIVQGAARPIPFSARSVYRLITFVGIQIPLALPALARAGHGHFHPRTGRNGTPTVQALLINGSAEVEQAKRMHPHLPLDTVRERHAHFVDIDHQRPPVPAQLARSYRELLRISVTVLSTPFGHGPAFGMPRIKRHVQGTVVVGLDLAAALRPCVIR